MMPPPVVDRRRPSSTADRDRDRAALLPVPRQFATARCSSIQASTFFHSSWRKAARAA